MVDTTLSGLCTAYFLPEVLCTLCKAHYHAICTGHLAVDGYVCCKAAACDSIRYYMHVIYSTLQFNIFLITYTLDPHMYSVLQHQSVAGALLGVSNKTQHLLLSDVKSVMEGCGISNGIVDFFIQ